MTLALGVSIVGTFDRQGGPADPVVHVEVDNYATRQHSTAKRWLVERPRCSTALHAAPGVATERSKALDGVVGEKPPKRGRNYPVRELTELTRGAPHRGPPRDATAFVWAATAQSILDKVECSPTRMPAARR